METHCPLASEPKWTGAPPILEVVMDVGPTGFAGRPASVSGLPAFLLSVLFSTLRPVSVLAPPAQATAPFYSEANQGQEKAGICPGPATWFLDPELQPAGGCLGIEHKDFKTGTLAKLTTWPSFPLRLSWAPGASCTGGGRGRPPTCQVCFHPRLLEV